MRMSRTDSVILGDRVCGQILTGRDRKNTFAAMKTCPRCQETVALNLHAGPRCGHRFIPAIAWVSAIVIALCALLGV